MMAGLPVLLVLAFLIGYFGSEYAARARHRTRTLAFALPVITNKGDTFVANFEIANDTVAFVPIQTLDAAGNPVAPPAGDTFTVTSSDTASLTAAVGTMPSGPLQGQPAAVLTPLVQAAANITITLTDADNLTAGTQIVDVVQGVATSDFLDIGGAVTQPQTPPAAKPA